MLDNDIKREYKVMKNALGYDVINMLSEDQLKALLSFSFNHPISQKNTPNLIKNLQDAAKAKTEAERKKFLFKAQAEMDVFKADNTTQNGLVIRRIKEMLLLIDNSELCLTAEKKLLKQDLKSTAETIDEFVANPPKKTNKELLNLLENIVVSAPKIIKNNFGDNAHTKLTNEQILAINKFAHAKDVNFSNCKKLQNAIKNAISATDVETKNKALEEAQGELDVFKNNPDYIKKRIREMKLFLNNRLGVPAQQKLLKAINTTFNTDYKSFDKLIENKTQKVPKEIIELLK